jgi:hypothetical protein
MLTLIFFPKPYYALTGYLRGESFLDGYPSSFYRDRIRAYRTSAALTGPARWYADIKRAMGLQPQHGPSLDIHLFRLQSGGTDAFPVACELLREPESEIKFAALLAIVQISQNASHLHQTAPDLSSIIPELESLLKNQELTYGKPAMLSETALSLLMQIDPLNEKAASVIRERNSKRFTSSGEVPPSSGDSSVPNNP